MIKIIGIYKITSPSGKVYIGQSIDIKKRIRHYRSKNECKKQRRLFYSFKKYGFNNHKFEVIEECSVEKLNERERYWQEYYDVIGDNGLNCVLTETNDKSGKTSEDTLAILRQKQSGKNNGMYGKKHSEETKEKMRQKALGRKASDQARLNMSKSHKNRIVSNETRIKLSIANSGSNHHQYGRKVSEETKRKISQTLIKNNLSKQKKVIDLKTGIIYNSYKELAEEIGVKYSTLKTWLSGKVSKITNYKYIEND